MLHAHIALFTSCMLICIISSIVRYSGLSLSLDKEKGYNLKLHSADYKIKCRLEIYCICIYDCFEFLEKDVYLFA